MLRRRGPDALGAAHAALGRLWDASLVQREADDHAAVFLHEGQDGGQALGLCAHGVYHRLAVIAAHGLLQGPGVGAVQLQRQGRDALQGADGALQGLGLIHAGQADVHVQDVRARLLLGQALGEQVFKPARSQGLLELGLSRGIYPLAHDDGAAAQLHSGREGGDDGFALSLRRGKGQAAALADKGSDVLRRRAAAAAQQLRAGQGYLPHAPRKILRPQIEHRLPVH